VGPLAVLGFCMGGRKRTCWPAPGPDLAGRGRLLRGNIMKPWEEGPAPSPFDLTAQIACPVVGFFGAGRHNPSPDDVKKIDAELTKHGKPHEFHMYEGRATPS